MAYVKGKKISNRFTIREYTCSHCCYILGDQDNAKQIEGWYYCPYCGVPLKRNDYGKALFIFPMSVDLTHTTEAKDK